jgi:diguanylate cyclase (GGDEF)-like protein
MFRFIEAFAITNINPRINTYIYGDCLTSPLLWCCFKLSGSLRLVRFLAVLCFLFVCYGVSAAPLIELNGRQTIYDIDKADFLVTDKDINVDVIVSESSSNTWQVYEGARSGSLADNESLWLRFDVVRPALSGDSWLLALRLATLHHVQIYTYNTLTEEVWGSLPIGLKYPVDQRYKQSRQPAFHLPLQPGQPIRVYVKIVSPNLIAIPMVVMQEETFDAASDRDLLVIGSVLGALLVMFLYNLSLYSILRDISYFYYSLYVGSALLYLVSLTSVGACYLWPQSRWLVEYGTLTFAGLSFFSATLFVRDFLELRKYGGILLHSNTVLLVMWGAITAILSFSDDSEIFSFLGMASIVTCMIGLAVAIYLSFKKSATAIIFTFAWLILILGTMTFTLMLKGVLPFNFVTAYAQMFGMVIEMVLLSFALAYRIHLDRIKRERAQEEALDLAVKVSQERSQRIIAQTETLDLQRNLNETLEEQVKIRTQQYEGAMDKLEVLNAELQELSLTDQLSQLPNRRCFDERIAEECRRACREDTNLAVILVDIDHFKNINDSYGHSIGDVCISTVASLLKQVVSRPGDLIARYGGEEFVYMLPNTSEHDACLIAEKARVLIEGNSIDAGASDINITASFGVSSCVPVGTDAFPDIVSSADAALYRAKGSGRNRVVAASE